MSSNIRRHKFVIFFFAYVFIFDEFAFITLLWQEGRIDEDGCLQCSYHGWSFNGEGACTKIPQASPEGPEARAVQSPRARVARLPTLVSQGLLFVWPDENGWEKASHAKPPLLVYPEILLVCKLEVFPLL